jgi:hypothetical protein
MVHAVSLVAVGVAVRLVTGLAAPASRGVPRGSE